MITLQWIYVLAGLMFAGFAVLTVLDPSNPKRLKTAAFWGLLAVSFLFGSRLGDLGNGLLVVGLAAMAGFGGLGSGSARTTSASERAERAARRGDRLFLVALIIPVTALVGTLVLAKLQFGGVKLIDAKDPTLISLGLGALGGVAALRRRQP